MFLSDRKLLPPTNVLCKWARRNASFISALVRVHDKKLNRITERTRMRRNESLIIVMQTAFKN